MFSKLLYIVNIHVSSNKKEELKLRRSFLSVKGGGGGKTSHLNQAMPNSAKFRGGCRGSQDLTNGGLQ